MYNSCRFGWQALVVIISLIQDSIIEAGPTAARNASTIDDDIDDFIPYRGERFDTFDWNLFKVMAKKYSGNMLVSPISAKLAMIYLYEGAQGQTAQELSNAMHLPISRAVTRDKFTYILNSLQAKNPDYSLNIGTRMYIDSAVQLRQRYAAIIKMFYSTDVLSLNSSDTHATADSINNWVKNTTENNIDKMIEDEKSLQGSVMIVVNALFFKGTWDRQPFSEKATRTGKFYPTATSSIDVPMMHSYGRFYYSSSTELDAKILRIPYSGHKYAMYFILPRKSSALDSLIDKLNPSAFSRQMWLMQDLSIAVGIPKFKFDFTSHLESTFRELGIQDIFKGSATLTGIIHTNRNSPQLLVSDILQKSGIEVNEKGTAAYVATEIQISNKIGEDAFIANRPFIFYIEDETTGTILFIGKIENPLQGIGNTNMTPNLPTRFGEEITQTNVPPGVPGVEERYNFFNIELLQTEGNLVVAPAGVKAALMTIAEGSGGQTQQQLLSTLRLPVDDYGVRDAVRRTLSPFSALQQSGINNTEITIATSLWMGKNVMISPNYKENLIRHYNSQVLHVDFADSVNSAKAINDWIKRATKNHVSSIVDPGGLSPDIKIILTTALYFKGTWLYAFDKKSTRSRCFQTFNSGCQEVNMMENFGQYSLAYVPSLDADVIEIPYTGGKISLILLLPTTQGEHALHILSKDLSYIPVSVLLKSLRETEVLLQIPRFSIENKLDLRPALERLGIKDLFDFKANLSGIISKGPTRVSSVLHNAKIEVNEAGTIAAAATAISVVPLMITSAPQTFKVNRPFLFGLVDLETNNLLFAGRVVAPDAISEMTAAA
ncbi:uncharacterized protein LOC117167393 isoform X2 [Belonocnema kinseyi]|uniref:uncharacterized protein LOC117167393 isoform X2 n=1 Tax=Belonocnema kinseyi TaxID=2817044 RepID=UPI00143CCE3E|nr:uncharacterized protein LOC117167393 isoform X2 [Belonocnema kinseyi]